MTSKPEQKFVKALKDVFIGAQIEGESGFINLMRIKSRYFEEGVFPYLMEDIAQALAPFPEFREELFEKLYAFFHRYFSESGSIYFRYTPLHQNVYERVYTNERDVMLFWKTHMLYYVKTDMLFQNMAVEVDGYRFFFDVSKLQHKKANEKRDLVYEFARLDNDTLVFTVTYSERARKTKIADIRRDIQKAGCELDEEILQQSFSAFERQNSVDYFINKDARGFLREQFDLWMYQYMFREQDVWSDKRVKQLQILKDVAFKIIDFIAQFEDELVRIWNKPKFVRDSGYVITLDRIAAKDNGLEILQRVSIHHNIQAQLNEWETLGIVDKDFVIDDIWKNDLFDSLNEHYQYLPLDTKYFKDMQQDILALFKDLDTELDGWLIKSENYQALQTIYRKYQKLVRCIYIDPPFKTGEDFAYVDHYEDSSWLSLMSDRLSAGVGFLRQDGSLFCHLDNNALHYGRVLLNSILGEQNFVNDIVWHYADNFQGNVKGLANNHDIILWFAFDKGSLKSNKVMLKLKKAKMRDKRIWSKEEGRLVAARDENGNIIYEKFDEKAADDVWTIGQSSTTKSRSTEYIDFDTQKPEEILRRIFTASTSERDIVLDFYLGSGTTCAVAHKMHRRWIGIEMGEHFFDVAMPRMKRVLFGEQAGVSKLVDWTGGGFFKYFGLEQYEETLNRAQYADAEPLFSQGDLFNQYVFLRDTKMLDNSGTGEPAAIVEPTDLEIQVNLDVLFDGIDLAETLSCLTGKWIDCITEESVEFEDGSVVSLVNPPWNLVKPLIWW